jgi:hypothetical protein
VIEIGRKRLVVRGVPTESAVRSITVTLVASGESCSADTGSQSVLRVYGPGPHAVSFSGQYHDTACQDWPFATTGAVPVSSAPVASPSVLSKTGCTGKPVEDADCVWDGVVEGDCVCDGVLDFVIGVRLWDCVCEMLAVRDCVREPDVVGVRVCEPLVVSDPVWLCDGLVLQVCFETKTRMPL